MDEIQSAIERLTLRERADVAVWLRDEMGVTGLLVAEPAASYDVKRQPHCMSVEEYLAFEERTGLKYEYVGGEIFAMTGTTVGHGIIVDNLSSAFHNHLRGGPCRAFSSGVKVRLRFNEDDIFYYPDVMVVCGKLNVEDRYFRDPKLVVEVLSPSTETIDRREKTLHYRQIAALEEYMLVAQRTREVTIYRRAEKWTPRVLGSAGDVAELRSIGLALPIERIYEGVF